MKERYKAIRFRLKYYAHFNHKGATKTNKCNVENGIYRSFWQKQAQLKKEGNRRKKELRCESLEN